MRTKKTSIIRDSIAIAAFLFGLFSWFISYKIKQELTPLEKRVEYVETNLEIWVKQISLGGYNGG